MPWTPMHEAHAIERVRLQFHFKEQLPEKALRKITHPVSEIAGKIGFNEISRSTSEGIELQVGPHGLRPTPASSQDGWVYRCVENGELVEELGLRDTRLGYVTGRYGRWQNVVERLEETLIPALKEALEVTDVTSAKLEYWDAFKFDDAPSAADAAQLLTFSPSMIPDPVLAGASNWHAHYGWFEPWGENRALINQNFDAVDLITDPENISRMLKILTLVQIEFDKEPLSTHNLSDNLTRLHSRSVEAFSQSIQKEAKEQIGIEA